MIERRPEGLAFVDGIPINADDASVPWSDAAVQWGWGVFETVAVRGGSPRYAGEHLDRMQSAAARCGVSMPSRALLERTLERVAGGIAGGHGWIKLLVARSGRWACFGGPSDPAAEHRPVTAVVLSGRRHRLDPAAGMKLLGGAPLWAGLEEAERRGADEGLWLNDRGHLIEACTANVFVVRGRRVTTPALSDGAIPGITRAKAIEALRQAGIRVDEGKVRMTTVRAAREIVLTSSLSGIRPVLKLDGRVVGSGRPGPIATRLQELFRSETPLVSSGG